MNVLACIGLYRYVSCVLVCCTSICVYPSVLLCIGQNRHAFIVFSITHRQLDDQTTRPCPTSRYRTESFRNWLVQLVTHALRKARLLVRSHPARNGSCVIHRHGGQSAQDTEMGRAVQEIGRADRVSSRPPASCPVPISGRHGKIPGKLQRILQSRMDH